MRILNLLGNQIAPRAREILTRLGDVHNEEMTQTQLNGSIEPYDVIFMGLYPDISKETLSRARNLKVIATAVTNPTHIDASAAEKKIRIVSLKGETDFLDTITGTSEMAVGLMIDLMRLTPWAFDDVKQHHWDRDRFRGHNLYGKTLGIFGFGRLGKWMARYGKAFHMKIIACSPHITDKECGAFSCRAVDFETLLSESDVLSINATLTDKTRHVFDAAAFKRMKPTAYIVNTTIGGIVDEKDLLGALQKGEVAGYGTDVLEGEAQFAEQFSGHPLVEYAKTHQNVIIVPHLGGMTHESREATDVFIAEKLATTLKK